jgi:hypothetical protein
LAGFTLRLERVGLLRCGFQEGGNIITAGAMADLTVNLPWLFFRVVGFAGAVFAVCSFVCLVCPAFFVGVLTELALPLLEAGFFSIAAVVLAFEFDLPVLVWVFVCSTGETLVDFGRPTFFAGVFSCSATFLSISGG